MTDPQAELYRVACGMQSVFNLTLRHLATGTKFEHRLEAPSCLVGSEPRCHWRLPSSFASQKEFFFQVVAGRIFCLDLGDSEDESQRIKRRQVGSSGLELHGFELHAYEERGLHTEVERTLDHSFADGSKSPSQVGEFELAMRNEGRRGVVVPIDKVITMLGRSPRCKVRFNTYSASRFHAACIATPDGVWIVDLKSRTGTFINEIPVRLHRMQVGDRLRIGPSRFEFRHSRGESHSDSHVSHQAFPVDRIEPRVADRSLAVVDDGNSSADGEVLSLVTSLAGALSRVQTERGVMDSQSIVRSLNDLLRMQSLQLEELRRLNSMVLSGEISPKALLGQSEPPRTGVPLRPTSSPIKPSGTLAGHGPEPDVHEWFQQENDETVESRSVAGLLKRLLGSG
jgi:hypothetical protein